jgi:hypothetical protein
MQVAVPIGCLQQLANDGLLAAEVSSIQDYLPAAATAAAGGGGGGGGGGEDGLYFWVLVQDVLPQVLSAAILVDKCKRAVMVRDHPQHPHHIVMAILVRVVQLVHPNVQI